MCLSEAVRSWADNDTLRDNAGNGGPYQAGGGKRGQSGQSMN